MLAGHVFDGPDRSVGEGGLQFGRRRRARTLDSSVEGSLSGGNRHGELIFALDGPLREQRRLESLDIFVGERDVEGAEVLR